MVDYSARSWEDCKLRPPEVTSFAVFAFLDVCAGAGKHGNQLGW